MSALQPGFYAHPYVLFGALAVVAAAVCGAAAWRRRSAPGNRVFAALVWCIGLECLFSVLRLATGVWAVTVAATYLVALLVVASGILTFVFVAVYLDAEAWLAPRRLALASVPPVFFWVAILTNPFHGLIWAPLVPASAGSLTTAHVRFGPLGWASLAYVGVYAAGALGRFEYMYWRDAERHDRQGGSVFFSGVVMLVGLAVEVTGTHLYPSAYFGPYLFALASPFMLWGLYGYDFLDLVPVARTKVVEGMQDGVAVVDDEGRVVDVNERMSALVDAPEADLVGRPAADTLDGWGIADGGGEGELETWYEHEGGRHFRVRRDPIRGDGDGLRGHVVVFSDVTEQKRRETELRRQNERLDQFADTVAHDLRNPLAIAKSYASELEREDPAIPPEEASDQVNDALDRMDDMIEDILTLAREGNTIDAREAFDLADVTARAWSNVATPEATLDADAALSLSGDPDRLQRALENLFRNAVEHGGDDVTVGVAATDGGFRVTDDGPGVPEDRRDKVLEDGYTTEAEGTGFGLSIVKAIVEAHGWSVTVGESEDGGAAFDVRT